METKYIFSTNMWDKGQNHTWTHVAVPPVVQVASGRFKPAQVMTVIVVLVPGKSYLQLEQTLGDQLNKETKYISSTNIRQHHTWTHVAVLPVLQVASGRFKPALVLTVTVEVVPGKLYYKVNEHNN